MTSYCPLRSLVLAPVALALASPALAGRPLSVDDAGTSAGGEGHVEVWMTRAEGAKSYNISPAYALRDGLEISALLSRETPDKITTTALQLKVLFTPSKEDGCNFGAGVGVVRARAAGDSENGSFINGIASCNGTPLGNVHANLGYTKPSSAKGVKSLGRGLRARDGRRDAAHRVLRRRAEQACAAARPAWRHRQQPAVGRHGRPLRWRHRLVGRPEVQVLTQRLEASDCATPSSRADQGRPCLNTAMALAISAETSVMLPGTIIVLFFCASCE